MIYRNYKRAQKLGSIDSPARVRENESCQTFAITGKETGNILHV
jgi:hypothetical protein